MASVTSGPPPADPTGHATTPGTPCESGRSGTSDASGAPNASGAPDPSGVPEAWPVSTRRMPVRRWLGRTLLRLGRWRRVGTAPAAGVFIGAPHTSNWDFVLAVLLLWADGVPPRMLVKSEIFRWPLGPVLRAFGAIPTERKARTGLVERMAQQAAASDEPFVLVFAPDGTRSRADHWKSGFYRLALTLDLPVVLGFVDGATRTTGIGDVFRLTGDMTADMDRVRAFYADKRGIRPGNESTPRLREEEAQG